MKVFKGKGKFRERHNGRIELMFNGLKDTFEESIPM